MAKKSSFEIYWELYRQAKEGEIKNVPTMSKQMLPHVVSRIAREMQRLDRVYEAGRITADEYTEGMKIAEKMLSAF